MQTEINDNVHLAQVVTPRNHPRGGVKLIDIPVKLAAFEEMSKKIKYIDF